MNVYSREFCIDMLRKKKAELETQELTRYPQRSDFNDDEVNAIKSFLGPWPRALEKAGLKPVNQELLEKKKQKRIASRIRKRQYKIEARKTGSSNEKQE